MRKENNGKSHYLLELFVRGELYGAVWDDTDTVDAIPSHETTEAFLSPHPDETFPNTTILVFRSSWLYLPMEDWAQDCSWMTTLSNDIIDPGLTV